jgi:hypothetical protein
MISKGSKVNLISMGGLRFASPPVKAEQKRRAAKKKAAPAGDAVAAPAAVETAVTAPQLEIAAGQLAAAAEEPADQARAA